MDQGAALKASEEGRNLLKTELQEAHQALSGVTPSHSLAYLGGAFLVGLLTGIFAVRSAR